MVNHLIPDRYVKKDSIGAEIGVWQGRTSRQLVDKGVKRLYLIDPYIFTNNAKRWDGGKYGQGLKVLSQEDMDRLYQSVFNSFKEEPSVVFLRKKSQKALEDIPDESLDWVYIDGDHDYLTVKADLEGYYKKVKKGGVIMGDDYWQKPVRKAYYEYLEETPSVKQIKLTKFHFVLKKLS